MPITMYGQPGLVYAPLGGASYLSDANGLISNVADKDKTEMVRMGCMESLVWLSVQTATTTTLLKLSGAPISGSRGSFAGLAPPGALLVTDEPAVYQNLGTLAVPAWFVVGVRSGFALIGQLLAADMNSTDDQPFQMLTSPNGSFQIKQITATNAQASLNTVVGGIYTDIAKGGTAIVASGQIYSAITDPTFAFDLDIIETPGNTYWPDGTGIYLSLSTPQGAPALADFYIYGAN